MSITLRFLKQTIISYLKCLDLLYYFLSLQFPLLLAVTYVPPALDYPSPGAKFKNQWNNKYDVHVVHIMQAIYMYIYISLRMSFIVHGSSSLIFTSKLDLSKRKEVDVL